MAAATPPPHVVKQCHGVLFGYSDGTIIRLGNPSHSVPVREEDGSVVEWKEVIYDPTHNLCLRLYKPRNIGTSKLSRSSSTFMVAGSALALALGHVSTTRYCLHLASELNAIVISPDYRLAPEHRLHWKTAATVCSGLSHSWLQVDHPFANPFGPGGSPGMEQVGFLPTLVVVGERDLLRDRAMNYVSGLKEMGKPVEVAEFKGEEHGFVTLDPCSESSNELMRMVCRFVEDVCAMSG